MVRAMSAAQTYESQVVQYPLVFLLKAGFMNKPRNFRVRYGSVSYLLVQLRYRY